MKGESERREVEKREDKKKGTRVEGKGDVLLYSKLLRNNEKDLGDSEQNVGDSRATLRKGCF